MYTIGQTRGAGGRILEGMSFPIPREDPFAVTTEPTSPDAASRGDQARHLAPQTVLTVAQHRLQGAVRCWVRPRPDRRRVRFGPDELELADAPAGQDIDVGLV